MALYTMLQARNERWVFVSQCSNPAKHMTSDQDNPSTRGGIPLPPPGWKPEDPDEQPMDQDLDRTEPQPEREPETEPQQDPSGQSGPGRAGERGQKARARNWDVMKPKRSNPLKWAAWGAFVGLAVVAVTANYGAELPFLLGRFVGGAAGAALLAGITALIRNLFIR